MSVVYHVLLLDGSNFEVSLDVSHHRETQLFLLFVGKVSTSTHKSQLTLTDPRDATPQAHSTIALCPKLGAERDQQVTVDCCQHLAMSAVVACRCCQQRPTTVAC